MADIVPMSLVAVHMYEPCSALVVCLNIITPLSIISILSGSMAVLPTLKEKIVRGL